MTSSIRPAVPDALRAAAARFPLLPLLPLVRVGLPGMDKRRVTGPALVGKIAECRFELRQRSGIGVVLDRTKDKVATKVERKLAVATTVIGPQLRFSARRGHVGIQRERNGCIIPASVVPAED